MRDLDWGIEQKVWTQTGLEPEEEQEGVKEGW